MPHYKTLWILFSCLKLDLYWTDWCGTICISLNVYSKNSKSLWIFTLKFQWVSGFVRLYILIDQSTRLNNIDPFWITIMTCMFEKMGPLIHNDAKLRYLDLILVLFSSVLCIIILIMFVNTEFAYQVKRGQVVFNLSVCMLTQTPIYITFGISLS